MRKQLKHNKLKILKIDVEGGEWSLCVHTPLSDTMFYLDTHTYA